MNIPLKNLFTTRIVSVISVSALLSIGLVPTSVAQDAETSAERSGRFGAGFLRGGGRGGERSPADVIKRLDVNNDGQLSAAEYLDGQLQRVDALFERRDHNGDGLLSRAETEPRQRGEDALREGRREGRREGGRARVGIDRAAATACVNTALAGLHQDSAEALEQGFASHDSNGDGQLSLAEVSAALQARAQEQFARIDANGDGLVDESELRVQFAARQNTRQQLRACVRGARGEEATTAP